MFNFRSVGQIGQAITGAITKLSAERAVAAQVRANGGAMNLSAQSSVQSHAEAVRKERRDVLLGHAANMNIVAPQGPSLESHAHDQHSAPTSWPFQRRRGSGGKQQQGQKKKK